MKKETKFPFWFLLHTDNLARFRRTLRTITPVFLGLYIIIIFIFSIKLMDLPSLRLNAISNLDVLQKTEIVEFAKIIFGYGIAEWLVTVLSLGLLLAWAAFAFLAWILTRLAIEVIWQIFYPTDPRFFRMYCRYTRFLFHAFRRSTPLFIIIAVLVAAFILIEQRIWAITPEKGAIVIGITLLIAVPYVWAVNWFSFFRIIRHHPRAYYLDQYFFSQHTARRRLKNIVDILVFLAILTWILLPGYFNTCKEISNKVAFAAREVLDYEGKWNTLSQKVIFNSSGNERWMIPSPSEVEDRLDFAGGVRTILPLTAAFPTFQKYLFALIMFASFFDIGIPAIFNAVRQRGYRVALRRILVATVKTAIFLVILQLVVQKSYFIDMSELVGIGAMFSFIISFTLSHDETFYKKWKSRPIRTSTLP
jgi:hypothetical protein